MNRVSGVIVSVLTVAASAACSTPTQATAPPTTTITATVTLPVVTSTTVATPTNTELGAGVGSVEELKDAAVAAGYTCPAWDQDNRIAKAAESGQCSDADVLSTYTSADARDQIVAYLKTNSTGELSLLVGPNWIINGKGAPALAGALGGTVVTD